MTSARGWQNVSDERLIARRSNGKHKLHRVPTRESVDEGEHIPNRVIESVVERDPEMVTELAIV